jgi:hypothetical protein
MSFGIFIGIVLISVALGYAGKAYLDSRNK